MFSLLVRELEGADHTAQGFHWEEKQDSGRFLSTAGEAFRELKGVPRKVLIANKIPV